MSGIAKDLLHQAHSYAILNAAKASPSELCTASDAQLLLKSTLTAFGGD
jgi:hypothetical protein